MSYTEKLQAIVYLMNNDGAEVHLALQALGFSIYIIGVNDYQRKYNEKAIDDLFACLAYKEYLKKKAEFLLPLRDSRGRFKSNNNGKRKL